MNKYQRLLSNTVLFAISSFSSKIMIFLLMPFYTGILAPAETAVADQIIKSGNLMIPLVSLGIAEAVIRFGLDEHYKKSTVFTNGVTAIAIGFCISLLFAPLINLVPSLKGNVPLLYLFVLISVSRNLCSQFVRSRMYTRLYAIDGIFNTACYVGFMILFLKVCGFGIQGFVLSTVAADFCSGIFLFTVAGLRKYFKPSDFNRRVFKEMLIYSLPLIPSAMFWWVTNTSDQFFIYYMCTDTEAGLYTSAYRIPHLIMMVSTLFTEAWQLSAVTDGGTNSAGREHFFSRVFLSYQGLLFTGGAGLILFCKVFMRLLCAESYYSGWQYIPMLVIAMIFSCFVTFMGSVYVVEKRTGPNFYTMLIGAVLNLLLNAALIPFAGPFGASFATFISYLVVFIIRALTSRKYIKIKMHPVRMGINVLLLFIEMLIVMTESRLWILWATLVTLFIVFFNFGAIWLSFKKIFAKRSK